jgi:heterodisulfide reductase subunit A-like polyferredoxin
MVQKNSEQHNQKSKEVLVIGGGICGTTTAIKLADAGYKVTIIERQKELLEGTSDKSVHRISPGFHYLG